VTHETIRLIRASKYYVHGEVMITFALVMCVLVAAYVLLILYILERMMEEDE